ncbi:MAG: DUF2318 domain-containing protein [Candidatus Hodarchaeales archaeon]|jgi:uncharacterized membrane protein
MTNTLKENKIELTAEERDLPLEEEKGSWNFLAAVVLITIIGFAAILMLQGGTNPGSQFLTPQREGDKLVLSVSSLNSVSTFYSFDSNGVDIHFFAVLGSDNEARVAYDACDVCFEEKKGYYQDGNVMVCINCGRMFSIDSIGTENLQGGCWPSYLPMTISGDDVHITISDIESKKYLFS